MEKQKKNPKAEAKRIINLTYSKNEQGEKVQNTYLIAEVYLKTLVEMTEFFELIRNDCKNVIMALFTEIDNGFVIHTYVPEDSSLQAYDFLDRIITPLKLQKVTMYKPAQNDLGRSCLMEFTFHKDSEYYPEKVVSQAMSFAFNVLRILGIHKDDEEEKEYNFDDLEY